MRSTRSRALAVIGALILLGSLAACGGDDDSSSSDQKATTTQAKGKTSESPDAKTSTTESPVADGKPVPSPGCAADPETDEVQKEEHHLTVGGTDRMYLLTAPAGSDPAPLVLDIHGLGEGAQVHTKMSMMGELGLEEGFVTAFPQGTGAIAHWDAGNIHTTDLDDIDAVIDEIGTARCIDTSRVYAMGLSNGAMMTSLLACTRSDTIAAFVPVSGLFIPSGCDPKRRPPIMTFHGTADPILRFNGGITLDLGGSQDPASTEPIPEADLEGKGYPETARQWAAMIGCDEKSTDEQITDDVIKRTWECPDGSAMIFYIVLGGGHSWPGSEFSKTIASAVGPTSFDIDASKEAWKFFQRWQLPA